MGPWNLAVLAVETELEVQLVRLDAGVARAVLGRREVDRADGLHRAPRRLVPAVGLGVQRPCWCRFARSFIHPIPDFLDVSAPPFLKRRCDRGVDLGEHRDLVADERLRQEAIGVDPDLAVAADRPHLQV